MDDLYSLLQTVRPHCALFIGSNEDIQLLFSFLNGYVWAKNESRKDASYGAWLFEDFRLWLANRYCDNRDFNWAILVETYAKGNPIEAFFALLDEYAANL